MGLSTEQIEDFLDKLNDDADFRDNLKNNTLEVLEACGFDTSEVIVPPEVQLPSVGEVNANRDTFREALFPENAFMALRPWFKLPPVEDQN